MNILFTILALAVFFLHWGFTKKRPKKTVELLLGYLMLFAVGLSGIGAFIAHVFYSNQVAELIGWSVGSPFQFEVGIDNLALGTIAFLSFWFRGSFLFAALLANVIWLWGDGVGHLLNMMKTGNFAPGNAGSYFWYDVFIPLLLLIVYWIRSKQIYD